MLLQLPGTVTEQSIYRINLKGTIYEGKKRCLAISLDTSAKFLEELSVIVFPRTMFYKQGTTSQENVNMQSAIKKFKPFRVSKHISIFI